MTRKELFSWGSHVLYQANVPDANTDAWLLLEDTLNVTRAEYLLYSEEIVSDDLQRRYEKCINQRRERKPLQYIIGYQEFMGLRFRVNESVLIPRQDTEILVELALPYVKDKQVLDMCTGSGCIAISLQCLGHAKNMLATDISKEALCVARQNAMELQSKVEFRESDLWEQVSESFDVIVSNPPYIETGVVATLMPEVRDYEPNLALDGCEDGCYYYQKIIEQVPEHLNHEGYVFLEIGYNQAEQISELLSLAGLKDITVSKDYAGCNRVVSARRE